MGRPTNLPARRAQVADALLTLLAEDSLERITIASIAKQARLRPGLIHHYFANKEDVLRAALERLVIQLEVRASERLHRAGEEPRARIDAFIDAWLAVEKESDRTAAFAWAAIGDEARSQPDVRVVYSAALSRAQDRLFHEILDALPASRRRRARPIAEGIVVAIEGALRVRAGAGLEPGGAAALVRGMAAALLNDAAASA